jgi:NAD(P)-dependent dehydrogenase (short-subunit alcohol dehydrogenase family)
MTISQQKIGSGFGASSTADEVLSGIDLTGKLAIVTGGYSGIGLETTRALRRAGADVLVPARRPDAARAALGDLDRVEVDALDLGELESVRAFAEQVLAADRSVDILINNAGIMACPETRVGPGWEAQFATNHLGHYELTNRLWSLPLPSLPSSAVCTARTATSPSWSPSTTRPPAAYASTRSTPTKPPGYGVCRPNSPG